MQKLDVIVIGGGIAGLSAAYHLWRAGITRLAVSSGPPESAASRHSAGQLAGGQVDNFTRLSHARGEALAAHLWRFGDLAFDELAAFCASANISLRRGRRLRLITSEPEMVEARKAVELMKRFGFPTTLRPRSDTLSERILGIQDDGPRAAFVDITQVLAALEHATAGAQRVGRVTRLETSASGAIAHCDEGQEVHAELAIVAAHLASGDLVPDLKQALVPYADQWTEVKLAKPALAWTGTAFSANHGYEWGVFSSPDVVRVGGGRYLRPMAGIEATASSVDPKITSHLIGQLGHTFTFGRDAVAMMTAASREIRPCDELPVIGPMYGHGRTLIATGFMGAGLTQGFLAGRCVADLVRHGRCDALPRELWPERLRTMEA